MSWLCTKYRIFSGQLTSLGMWLWPGCGPKKCPLLLVYITSTTGGSRLCHGRWKWCLHCPRMLWKISSGVHHVLNWVRHLSPPCCSRVTISLFFWARVVGESIWKTLETHSNKTNTVLKVLKPDTTYQVKVQVQCLSKAHNTNDFVTLRTPEGCKCFS